MAIAKRPWVAQHDEYRLLGKWTNIINQEGEFVAMLRRPENDDNAAHIVKCVNAHDKLVEALRKIKTKAAETWAEEYESRGEIHTIATEALKGVE